MSTRTDGPPRIADWWLAHFDEALRRRDWKEVHRLQTDWIELDGIRWVGPNTRAFMTVNEHQLIYRVLGWRKDWRCRLGRHEWTPLFFEVLGGPIPYGCVWCPATCWQRFVADVSR